MYKVCERHWEKRFCCSTRIQDLDGIGMKKLRYSLILAQMIWTDERLKILGNSGIRELTVQKWRDDVGNVHKEFRQYSGSAA